MLSLFFPVAVSAAGPMKPGLWEMTMKSDAMKNMPKITPAQMQQMRKMGIKMPQMQDGGMVTRVCISNEMAAFEQPPERTASNPAASRRISSAAAAAIRSTLFATVPT